MTKIYVKYIKRVFHICDIDDADFSVYSTETDFEKIVNELNSPFLWGKNSEKRADIFLGFKIYDKGYDYFKSCKRYQKMKYVIEILRSGT